MSGSGMEMPPPENPDDPGRGPMIMGTTWTMTGLSIIVVSIRMWTRIKSGLLGADDWFMLAALAAQIACQGLYVQSYSYGLGMHDADLTMDQLISIQMWNYIITVPNLLVAILARISAAILLIRLFGTKLWFKWYLIIFTTITAILVVAYVPVLYTQSDPIEGLWDPSIDAERHPTERSQNIVYAIQACLTFSDLTYVLFPILIVYKLNMPTSRKLALVGLLGVGLITMAFSIMKTIQVDLSIGRAGPNNEDMQYNTSLIIMWSGLEQNLVIILSCVPALRTLGKLEIPFLSSLTTSLARLFSTRGSRSSTNRSSKIRTEYYDLESQRKKTAGQFKSRSEDEIPITGNHTLSRTQYKVEGSPSDLAGPHIVQTNQFSLNYEKAAQPEHRM